MKTWNAAERSLRAVGRHEIRRDLLEGEMNREIEQVNVWVMGIEVNQGLQDYVFTDLDNPGNRRGFADPEFANPLIPGNGPLGIRVGGQRGVVAVVPRRARHPHVAISRAARLG